jgi:hypothetical protein
MNQKGIAHLALIILVLVGVIIGIYLIQNPQIFSPKAEERTIITIPIYRLYNPTSNYWYWSRSLEEVNNFVAKGFKNEGVLFNAFVPGAAPAGTVPL